MSIIAKNIAHLRKLKGMTQEAFAEDLGIKKSRLGSYEEGRSSPPIEILLILSDSFRLPVDVLVRTDLSKSENLPEIRIGRQRVLFPITVNGDGNDLIEVVTESAKAGYLRGYSDPEYISELPTMELPFRSHGKLRAFPICGDSMPPMEDGDMVIGRYLENPEGFKEGKCHVVVTLDEGIVFKRVYQGTKPNHLSLRSDNPLYPPYEIHLEEVMELWALEYTLQKGEPLSPDAMMDSRVLNTLEHIRTRIDKMESKLAE